VTTQVVVPLLAAALGAIGGWLSSYVLKRRDDRLLGRAVARRLELELEWAEALMRTVLPGPSGDAGEHARPAALPGDVTRPPASDSPRGRRAVDSGLQAEAIRDAQVAHALSIGDPIEDWGEQHDWRIATWDDVEARNRLAMRLGDNDSWDSASRCVMRLDNLQRWVALARKDATTYPWPAVRAVASVVEQVARTRADLRRTEGATHRRRLVLSALAGSLVLAVIAATAVWEATDEDLSARTVAQQLRDTLEGESIVNCSARASARWDCTVAYDGCGPDASPTGAHCDSRMVRSEEHWILTTDPERRCTSARVQRVWRTGDTRPEKPAEHTTTPARLLGDGCTRD
jgi:hypothetical protein